MEILIYTKGNKLLGLADHLQRAGHSVVVSGPGSAPHGMSNYKPSYIQAMHESSFVIAEEGGVPEALYKSSRLYNKPIIGANKITDIMNRDCVKEFELGSKLGLPYPRTVHLSGPVDLYSMITDRWTAQAAFIKYDRVQLSCEEQEWMAWSVTKVPNKPMLLQEAVDGVRLDVEGWFNGFDWVKPFIFKTHQGLGDSRLIVAEPEKSKLGRTTLGPLKPFLRNISYKGPITAKLITNDKGAYVISLEAGIDPLSLYALLEGIKGDTSKFLHDLAFGHLETMDLPRDFYISSSVQAPTLTEAPIIGAPIVGIDEGNLKHLFLNSVFRSEDTYMVSDASNLIYVATARGRTVTEAVRRVQRPTERVKFPMMLKASVPRADYNTMLNAVVPNA